MLKVKSSFLTTTTKFSGGKRLLQGLIPVNLFKCQVNVWVVEHQAREIELPVFS